MAVLLTMVGPDLNKRFDLDATSRSAYIIGRGGATLSLSDPTISNRHAELNIIEDTWILRDLGSLTGTYLNSKRITGPVPLKSHDQLRCGATVLLFLQKHTRLVSSRPQLTLQVKPDTAATPDSLSIAVSTDFLSQLELALASAIDTKEMLVRGAEIIIKRDDTDCVFALQYEPGSGKCTSVAEFNKNPAIETIMYTSIVEEVLAAGTARYIPDLAAFRNRPPASNQIQSVLIVPIKSRQAVKGALYLGSAKLDGYTSEQVAILTYTGIHLGLSMDMLQMMLTAKQNQRLCDAGQTAVNLSHTLKNIIQVIGGATEVLDFAFETKKFDKAQNSWGILKRNLDRIRKFTLDMLAFSRDSKAIFTTCKLNKLVESAVEACRRQSSEKGVSLVLEMDEDIPEGNMDADKIHDVMLNLIMNAIDAVDHNKGVISVLTEYVPDKKAIHLRVKDNGSGIKPEDLDKVFLPYHTTKAKTGTGLGLAIVKRIIEQHNGTITVASELNIGTTFDIILPV